jgi:hypothetical protein
MKLKSILGILVVSLALLVSLSSPAQTPNADANANSSASSQTPPQLPPVDQLVTMTCRQAWHAGGKTQEGFFAIVQQLTELSARNRGVTIPDDKAAGERAGEWIRTQALKDPDQLLYAVVDHAVQYSISKGRAKPTGAAPASPTGK